LNVGPGVHDGLAVLVELFAALEGDNGFSSVSDIFVTVVSAHAPILASASRLFGEEAVSAALVDWFDCPHASAKIAAAIMTREAKCIDVIPNKKPV